MNEILAAENLKKTYMDGSSELHVLKSINLKVMRRDLLAITGVSGSGKSTLLHLLGALDTPTGGKVYLDGIDMRTMGERKLANVRNSRFGFIFQFYYLLPEFSVFENVLMPAMVRRKNKAAEEKAGSILERVGLKERMNHYPAELSGGEMQRAAIARALINAPEIIFADEPTGNLDNKNSRSILDLIIKLNDEEHQVFIIATHESTIARIARRTFCLNDGVLEPQ